MIQVHDKNTKGVDYFVGDIHGQYTLLMNALKEKGFDFEKDRLFSVGDIVDRGPESYECTQLIYEPWFFMVKGNHEDMMIDFVMGSGSLYAQELWYSNGGRWYSIVEDKQLADDAIKHISVQPYVRKVGDIMVIHAEYFGDADNIEDRIKTYHIRDSLIWGRERFYGKIEETIDNVDAVVCGHTPLKKIVTLGNTVYLDNGFWGIEGKSPNVLSYDEVLRYVKDV